MYEVNSLKIQNRIHIEILPGQNGLYIVRFRIYDYFNNLKINIQDKDGAHISDSPYFIDSQYSIINLLTQFQTLKKMNLRSII